mmetsp:Transcript_13236/g.42233  ORF Transcript_13236/g.42233 Transcript_13236/m.42233 type:complete len:257 (+) Transcript_13236:128-898(+)
MPSSSGMYALGRGSAVVRVNVPGCCIASSCGVGPCAALAMASCSRVSFTRSCRQKSASAPSDGAPPRAIAASAPSTASCRSSRSCRSLMAVAWYSDNSDTVAISLRVTSRMRACCAFTCCASSVVSARPERACSRSLLLSIVTSSSTSSFSTSSFFCSFSRSCSTAILASSCSSSGSSPCSGRQRSRFLGVSRSRHSFSVISRLLLSSCCSDNTFSASAGMSGITLRVTASCRCSSLTDSSSIRASDSRASSCRVP